MTISLTRLTNDRAQLTKVFSLDADGRVVKHTKAFLAHGEVERIEVADLHGFAALLQSLKHNQALAYGLTVKPRATVVTKDVMHEHPGAIARSRDYFSFAAGPAMFMCDHDADHASDPLNSADALRDALIKACPALSGAPMLWCASSSSFIERSDGGAPVTGLRGQRMYIPFLQGTDIERAGAALYAYTWLAGYGHYLVSKNGRLLDRSIIDGSVYQPERIDFAAGAMCHPPLVQRRPDPKIWNGGAEAFDSRLIPDLDAQQRIQLAEMQAAARARVRPEADRVRAAYIEDEAQGLAVTQDIDIDRAREIVRAALEDETLYAEFVLMPEEGRPVTVGEVLDNPARWHNKRFADPCEPGYRNDRRVAWLNLRSGGRPYLWSWAHGGIRYDLVRQPRLLKLQAGEMSRLADDSLDILRAQGEVFDFGDGAIARVAEGRVHIATPTWILDYLGRVIRFERFDGRAKDWVPADAPEKLAKFICDRTGERGLPKLTAVITAPTLRPDGTALDMPGYDEATGLLFLSEERDPLRVPVAPTFGQVQEAFAELWAPFAMFPFADDESRGVMLAALLTAVLRRAIPTAPGFAFDAPAAGTGKTKLAQCVAVLGGNSAAVYAPPRDEPEASKALFSLLLGGAGCVIWDNLVRPLEGAVLNAFLTAAEFSDRVLGASSNKTVPNRAMFIASGNNLTVRGDACRRILRCRIDAASETPFLRSFPFDPLVKVRDSRQVLVRAALTVLRGYQTLGVPMGEGELASFEVWDQLVRQCVVWCADMGVGGAVGLKDPAASTLRAADENPEKVLLGRVMEAWLGVFGDRAVTAAEALRGETDSLEESPAREKLREAVEELSDGDRNFSARRLGTYISKHRDEIVNSQFFAGSLDTDKKIMKWRVETAG
ncbi:hypothetical protein [Cupriavidus basilensis]|uniref:hypothetical protein n=1 Tax=Cupriavidus basilensis TaxID=68895 RepID=UPI000750C747|nr:hypothetical protein [Cupriavidus basilensis]